ncbi:MAG: hypothetical protein JWM80_5694 [Cyanobacteria bacterium RYN_339]|nr:hypothetical protein [Cyanobacteria bacterium RYN_339]
MTVTNTPGANPNQAAQEAQRAEERKRQEEEARKRAAEAARKKAEADAAAKAQQEPPVDRGFFGNIEKKVVEAANGKLEGAAATAEATAIKADMQAATTTQDLQKVADRAALLQERAKVSDDPEVRKQAEDIRGLNDTVQKANAAAKRIDDLTAKADGTPAEQADQTAALLSRPKDLTSAVADAKALAGSPLGDKLKSDADKLAAGATPAALAKQLTSDPDLSHYPPTMAKNLAAMRALQDPALNTALDGVGKNLLDRSKGSPNPLSYDEIQKNPDLVRLAQNAAASDPAAQGQLDKVVHDIGSELLKRDLGDKKGEGDVKGALDQFKKDFVALAQTGLDPAKLGEAAGKVLDENHKSIEKHVSDGEDKGDWWNPIDWGKKAFNAVKDIVSDVIGAIKDGVETVAKEAAKFFYDHVVDPALDSSALGKDTDTFKNENLGVLGDLVTNRLEVGESAFVRLDVNAKISGVVLGAGAQLELKRVPQLDAQGHALPPGPDGVPKTNLEVHVLCDANAGVGLQAKFGKAMGKDIDVKGNEAVAGASANAKAKAEAGVKAQAELVFSFDATKPQDLNDMTGLFSEAAKTGLEAAIPGIGPVLAACNAKDLGDSAVAFGRHLETVRGEVGVYALASVEGSINAGTHDREQKNQVKGPGIDKNFNPEKPDKPEAEKPADGKDPSLKDKAVAAGAGAALDAAGIDVAKIKAAVGGELDVGMEQNFKTGETTYYFKAKGQAKASAETVGVGVGVGAEYNRTVAVRIGKDGKVAGLDVSQEYTKEQFQGVGSTDIRGRVDSKILAQVQHDSKITVTRSFNDLASLQGHNPAAIIATHLADANSFEGSADFHTTSVKAKDTTKVELGGDIGVASIKLTLGRSLETDVTDGVENTTRVSTSGGKGSAIKLD